MATKYKIRITKDAQYDLTEIYDYIAEQLTAQKAAADLMAEIESSIMNLADFPYSSPAFSDDYLKLLRYRKLIIKKYIVVYSVSDEKKEIDILRIFYGPSDYMKYLL